MSNSSSKAGGFSIFAILFLILFTLKLASIGQVATWSWWWVTCPLWIPLGSTLIVMGIIALFLSIKLRLQKAQKKTTEDIKMKSRFQERLDAMTKERLKNKNEK